MGNLRISPELGFCKFNVPEVELEKGSLTFVHADPVEAALPNFSYAVVDTKKYLDWCISSSSSEYIPMDLDDLLHSGSLTPVNDYNKSQSKVQALLKAYAEQGDIEIKCPVFTDHHHILQQGRHRLWFFNHLNLPFFVVAASARALNTLEKDKLFYDYEKGRSRFVFNRKLEKIQDLLVQES
ncbi:hypothetical protein [Vibrio coralliilyticus]|uniref:Uncharacterized protein n=1 Tax=Vibrio coralliilyticus TaxID=190893 RepID=A0AAP6ZTV0_9VIBR|nr:hypothetical protein [Vibrio coralliilyticus]NOI31815.1 hypothetical protein [Vibrio coralliilyticus]NOJ25258.1 hypothetical protein [Vibrio coralliilyticus]